jgi:hypothetical protein
MRVGDIEKSATEVVRVSAEEFKGRKYLDIRVYFEDEGEWKPTKKGVTIQPDKVDAFIELVTRAKDSL